jgi:hypothetical protein
LPALEEASTLSQNKLCQLTRSSERYYLDSTYLSQFWNGSSTPPLPSITNDRPNAKRAAERAIDLKTPWDILGRADRRWKREHGDKFFGGSYLSPTPSIWTDQQLGLVCITHLTNHIRSALSNLRYNPEAKWKDDRLDGAGDDDNISDDDYYEWKYHVDGGINGRLDEDDEFDDDLSLPLTLMWEFAHASIREVRRCYHSPCSNLA